MELDNRLLTSALSAWAGRRWPGARVEAVRLFTGAGRERLWAFEVRHAGVGGDVIEPLVLLLGSASDSQSMLAPHSEARLLTVVAGHDVPVPAVRHVLTDYDGLGEGCILQRLDGEIEPARILGDDIYADAREQLARQCGQVLASIHQIPATAVSFLEQRNSATVWQTLYHRYLACGQPNPVFEQAFRWLDDHRPAGPPAPVLVHGDFRNGNLVINRLGLRAVVGWRRAGLGDPMMDLGWLCVSTWRFGNRDLPVGGFGCREQLFEGYQEASGRAVCAATVAYWELFGLLRWGVACLRRTGAPATDCGPGQSMARHVSEAEQDMLDKMAAPG